MLLPDYLYRLRSLRTDFDLFPNLLGWIIKKTDGISVGFLFSVNSQQIYYASDYGVY